LGDLSTFGEGVEPVGLDSARHDEEAAVFQFGGDALFGGGVFEVEFPSGAEAEAGDGGVFNDGGFVIAMPRHAFGAIVVVVEEAGVEGFAGGGFDACLELGEKLIPRKGRFGLSRISVVEATVAIPGDLASGRDGFAKHFHNVVLPR